MSPDLNVLASLDGLRTLDLGSRELGDVDLHPLQRMQSLQRVVLPTATFDAGTMTTLAGLPSLRELYFYPGYSSGPLPETLAPLQESASLKKVVPLTLRVDDDRRWRARIREALPGVTAGQGYVQTVPSMTWLIPAFLGLMAGSLGFPMAWWSRGSHPASVPRFRSSHRGLAWVVLGLILLAVAVSAWSVGAAVPSAVALAASGCGVLWLAPLRHAEAAGRIGDDLYKQGWKSIATVYAILVGSVWLLHFQTTLVPHYVLVAAVSGVAAFLLWRWDLRLRRPFPPSERNRASARTSEPERRDAPAASGDWPLPGSSRGWSLRMLCIGMLGLGAAILTLSFPVPALSPDRGGSHTRLLTQSLANGLVIGMLAPPVLTLHLRWRERLGLLRIEVPLPGGNRAVRADRTFRGMAMEHIGLWPLLLGGAALIAVILQPMDSSPVLWKPAFAGFLLLTSLACGAHAITATFWRQPVLAGTAGFATLCVLMFVAAGAVRGHPSLLLLQVVTLVTSLLLAFAADRVARRREREREWG